MEDNHLLGVPKPKLKPTMSQPQNIPSRTISRTLTKWTGTWRPQCAFARGARRSWQPKRSPSRVPSIRRQVTFQDPISDEQDPFLHDDQQYSHAFVANISQYNASVRDFISGSKYDVVGLVEHHLQKTKAASEAQRLQPDGWHSQYTWTAAKKTGRSTN
eukprot:1823017-Pyramimonas_sp.AAC.1